MRHLLVDFDDIAFRVAPRINAVGRIGSAAAAVRLMTTTDPAEAQHLAMELELANSSRKEIEAAVFDEAAGMILQDELNKLHSLVLYRNNWHPGVLGIVANRLVEKFCRPAILLTDVPGDDRDDAVRLVDEPDAPLWNPVLFCDQAGVNGVDGAPSSFMNIAHSVGTMMSATKSELVSVTMRVLGI